MAVYGYMRISTEDQRDDLQRDALVRAGVPQENIYTDTVSGSSRARTRPAFDQLAARLRSGDELVIWKFDRLGRSVLDNGESNVGECGEFFSGGTKGATEVARVHT